jgi:hypothetical protein
VTAYLETRTGTSQLDVNRLGGMLTICGLPSTVDSRRLKGAKMGLDRAREILRAYIVGERQRKEIEIIDANAEFKGMKARSSPAYGPNG